MATTTTYEAIRDRQIDLIEALVPAVLSHRRFQRKPQRQRLRAWAERDPGSGVLRRFEIFRSGAQDPPLLDPSAKETLERCMLSVAYPALLVGVYGQADLDSLEATMRSDARQIRDVLFSYANYLPGHSITRVEIMEPDRSIESVWFQDFALELIYTEAQNL
jgi:hypothetical protein